MYLLHISLYLKYNRLLNQIPVGKKDVLESFVLQKTNKSIIHMAVSKVRIINEDESRKLFLNLQLIIIKTGFNVSLKK